MLLTPLAALTLGLLLAARGRAWLGAVGAAAVALGGWALGGGVEAASEVTALLEWRLAAAAAGLAALVTGVGPLRRGLITARALARTSGAGLPDAPPVWSEPTEAERWLAAGRPALALETADGRAADDALPEGLAAALDAALAKADPATIRQVGGLPRRVWTQAAEAGLMGLGLPTDLGGRGLDPARHSTLVTRAATRCLELAEILAMAGPGGFADLVDRFGTDEQRAELLPPCASGAVLGAVSWTGVPALRVPRGTVVRTGGPDGALGLELDFRFEGVELAPLAGVAAVLVDVVDPEDLLGLGEHPGSTCVLVRGGTAGLERGARHRAIGSFTASGPLEARCLVVPLGDVLGGEGRVGHGGRVQEDSAERAQGWALPALSSGLLQGALRAASAHAQLHLRPTAPGTELARLAAAAHGVEALRTTLAALFDGTPSGSAGAPRPGRSLAGAARVVCAAEVRAGLQAARTIFGRAASFHGAHNFTAGWTGLETRLSTLFGEADGAEHALAVDASGAMLLALDGVALADAVRAGDLRAHDRLWVRRAERGASLWARCVLRSARRLVPSPAPVAGVAALARRTEDAGLAFATVADAASRRVHRVPVAARDEVARELARAMAHLVGAASTLRLARARGHQPLESPVVEQTLHLNLERAEDALDRVASLVAETGAARTLRLAVRRLTAPRRRGRLMARVRAAEGVLHTREVRARLTAAVHVPPGDEVGLGALEAAAGAAYAARAPLARIEEAMLAGQLAWGPILGAVDEAVERGIVSTTDRDNIRLSEEALRGIDTFEVAENPPALSV